MKNYSEMSQAELQALLQAEQSKYDAIQAKNLKLDMSRGKPSSQQLDMVMDVLDIVNSGSDPKNEDGADCRNYLLPLGLPEVRRLFAEVLGVKPEQVIAGGNSSLNLMFDVISQAMTHGFGHGAWAKEDKVKFIFPCPGYDRHFAVCEYFGIEMITVDMLSDGPDMDAVEQLVKDPAVKGIWVVPKYSNPTGITFSDDVVRRMAALKPAAPDFKIMWDNAYVVHDLYDTTDPLLNIMTECEKNGNEDMVIEFSSTSKITFPGGGVAVVAASDRIIKMIQNRMAYQVICPDKINHLRHARKFSNMADLTEHMKQFITVLKPKFDAVINAFEAELKETGAVWSNPRGGYFISIDVLPGTAKRVCQLCKEAGVVLTPAGATYPYGKDPKDSNIRIAPSFPPVSELNEALELFCVAVKIAAAEKLLA